MAQKVIQIGSSIGVTIPKDMADTMKIHVGDAVEVKVNEGEGSLSVVPSAQKRKASVDRELVDWIEGAIERYRPALEALADK